MYNVRVLFTKDKVAKYISHLDLMQVFRRAFTRIGLELTYSGGFHPHMHMNILLPLSTGFSSECELLDFELEGKRAPDNIVMRLNSVLPDGICVIKVIDSVRKAGEIAFAKYAILLETSVPADDISALFARDEITLLKRTKRGQSEVNIKPLIRELSVSQKDGAVEMTATLSVGQNNLNPEYLVSAVEQYLGAQEQYASYHRIEIYDEKGEIFR